MVFTAGSFRRLIGRSEALLDRWQRGARARTTHAHTVAEHRIVTGSACSPDRWLAKVRA
jgi:hypothetical protein